MNKREYFDYLIRTTTKDTKAWQEVAYYSFYLHGYNFANQRLCINCKFSRNTNLNNEVSHGELFCTELVRFFSLEFGCNKWEVKNG